MENIKTLLAKKLMETKKYDWLGKQVVFEINALTDEDLQRETAWKIQKVLREAAIKNSKTTSSASSEQPSTSMTYILQIP